MANSHQELIAVTEGADWLVGAVNYDEDLHFSSYYLRASCIHGTGDLYTGYTALVAFYDHFTERYYIPVDQCQSVARSLTQRALGEPDWLREALHEIVHRCDLLGTIFDSTVTAHSLSQLTRNDLVALYKRHDQAHRELYKYARLPEALDRGLSFFTGFLKDHLLSKGMSPEEAETAFAALTQPVTPSILAQELFEFEQLVNSVRLDLPHTSFIYSHPRLARMFLRPAFLTRLSEHRDKWKYLEYHGYGNRQLTTMAEYLERIVSYLSDLSLGTATSGLARHLDENREAKDKVAGEIKLEPSYWRLFELYPEIGSVKLYRRYAQLKNFYYLDLLLSEISRRLDVDEWTVRCMLPVEIMHALESGHRVHPSIEDRRSGCVYVLLDGREEVISGEFIGQLKAILERRTRKRSDRKVLKGIIASKGRVVGSCKIMIRPDDGKQFQRGNILVSEATDPDLLKFLKIAGGVLTEQGGVTSHAAIICRELGIPTIIGIEGLLDTVKDGDVVEVDANSGIVRLTAATAELPSGFLYTREEEELGRVVGAKAANLSFVRARGYSVPPFAMLRYSAVRRAVDDNSRSQLEQAAEYLRRKLSLAETDTVAVRSSAIIEDQLSGSRAGSFQTLIDIRPSNIGDALRLFVATNALSESGDEYVGAILVQLMIKGEYGGVCLTSEDRLGNGHVMVIELSEGANVGVTAGTITPRRILIDREAGDIIEDLGNTAGTKASAADVLRFVRTFMNLERQFGRPVDIEWVSDRGQLHILQVRPIVPTE